MTRTWYVPTVAAVLSLWVTAALGQDPDSGVADPPDQAPAAQRQKLQARAKQRAAADQKKYTRDQVREAEELYQVANKNWRTPEARQSLEQMVEKFPNINRTGCAVLYLAHYSRGDEQEKLLKQAIQKHSDCVYLNGVQVGAYARLLLGQYYQQNGEPEKAKPLFEEIRKKYPDAIGHRGESMVAKLPKE
jgi:tetratricopeptide (TPR) repeat protein